MRIFHTGYAPQLEPVTVAAGRTVTRDVTLSAGRPDAGRADAAVGWLDAFRVGESREMEAAAIAINEQRFAANVKNVVSTDEFGAVAEGNVAEFLRYLPGITVDLSGGDARTVSIDGAPAASTPMTIAGFNLPSPGNNHTHRAVQVGFFNLNNISRIEVSLSPTPDSPRLRSRRLRESRTVPLVRTHAAGLQRQRVPHDARRPHLVRQTAGS